MNPKNIKFNDLYRDSGNYKLFDSVIFTNPNNIDLETIQRQISKSLIDGEFFNPEEWKIPKLEFEKQNEDLDHSWHEFESVELTEEISEKMNTIDDFLDRISNSEAKPDKNAIEKFVKSGKLRNIYEHRLKAKPDTSTYIVDNHKEVKLDTLIGQIELEFGRIEAERN